ncbi:MAG: flagellar export chaperone FlgN [Armatimonadota bacterium]
MSTCKELGEALAGCLKEVSSLLAHAHTITLKQRDALVASDPEGISVTCKAHEEILRRVAEADQRAAALAVDLAIAADMDPNNTDPHSLASAAGLPYSLAIEAEMKEISSLAEKMRRANEINRKLLSNGLEIITGSMRAIANDPGPSSYSKDAHISAGQTMVLSLDTRV